jgi:hypothetical protein
MSLHRLSSSTRSDDVIDHRGDPDVTHTASQRVREMLNKVPEVTLIFWIIKIMSTTVGETGADYLAVQVGLWTTVTGAVMVCFLAIALGIQLRTRRYGSWVYWLTVVLVSVVGTQITGALTDKLEISLYVSTVGFAIALAITFAVWYWSERTLSIHTIVAARTLLLGRDPLHLCARNGGRRFGNGGARPRLQPRRRRVRRADRRDSDRLLLRSQRSGHFGWPTSSRGRSAHRSGTCCRSPGHMADSAWVQPIQALHS